MSTKNAAFLIIAIAALIFGSLFFFENQDVPSRDVENSLSINIFTACPISKDSAEFDRDIETLARLYANPTKNNFLIANCTIIRLDGMDANQETDSAFFDVPVNYMNAKKFSLIENEPGVPDERNSEEDQYFKNLNSHEDYVKFRRIGLQNSKKWIDCSDFTCLNPLDSIHEFVIDRTIEAPRNNKYWPSAAALRKHIESLFVSGAIKAKDKIRIYFACGPAAADVSATCKDTDGDTVCDEKDDCPSIPGKPVHNGCPDSDNDGVKDDWDDCPNVAGDATNGGCPSSQTTIQQEQNPKVPVRKVSVNITHNNNTGQFTVTNFDAKSMTSEVTIRLRNRKEIKVTPLSYIFPASKPEFNKLIQNISEGAGLYVVFNVYDLNTKEVISTFSLSDVSLVCIPSSNGQGTECGFVKM